jgi:cobalamin biosynthesis Mg chelatase CobN
MKLFKILMAAAIALIVAAMVGSALSSCHTLKKNSSTHETKSDSVVTSLGTTLRYDSVTGTYMVLRADSSHAVSTDDYQRKTLVEEFEVPITVHKEDYDGGTWYTGDSAQQLWQSGHGLLKKRTTVWEKGVLQKTETATSKAHDSAGTKATRKQATTQQDTRQGSRLEKGTEAVKQSSTTGRGWVIVVCFVIVIVALMAWLWIYLPKPKSESND